MQHTRCNIYEKNIPVPSVMIKAKAVKKTFQATQTSVQDGSEIITILSTGEPLFILPEGLTDAAEANDFRQALIKQMSDMQELKITGTSDFDATAGKVIKSDNQIECLLVLDGDKIGAAAGKDAPKGSGGLMFTSVTLKDKYEVIQ